VVGMAKVDDHRQQKTISDYRWPMQLNLALGLARAAGVDVNKVAGIPELELFQAALAPDYQLKVFSKDSFNNIIFDGEKLS